MAQRRAAIFMLVCAAIGACSDTASDKPAASVEANGDDAGSETPRADAGSDLPRGGSSASDERLDAGPPRDAGDANNASDASAQPSADPDAGTRAAPDDASVQGDASLPDDAGPDASADADVPRDAASDAASADAAIERDAGEPGDFGDLFVDVHGLAVERRTQFRLVEVANNRLLSIGLVEFSPAADFSFLLPNTVPRGELGDFRLDIWSDYDSDGGYDYPPTDEAWRVPLDTIDPSTLNFTHDTNYTDIIGVNYDQGMEFFAYEMGDYTGAALEIRGIELDSGRVVFRYVGHVPGGTVGVGVAHVFNQGVDYRIDFAIDADGNGRYAPPPIDPSWSFTQRAGETGLHISFTNNTDYQPVDF